MDLIISVHIDDETVVFNNIRDRIVDAVDDELVKITDADFIIGIHES